MTKNRDNLLELLANYQAVGPSEMVLREEFIALVDTVPGACERQRLEGHLTGSAWLVSSDGRQALLMHHRKLDRWLQPGGHADGDWDLAGVALREAMEETGLPDLQVDPVVFDLDKHRIPARGDVPEHWHYDLRFVVRASGSLEFSGNTESLELRWFPSQHWLRMPVLIHPSGAWRSAGCSGADSASAKTRVQPLPDPRPFLIKDGVGIGISQTAVFVPLVLAQNAVALGTEAFDGGL